MAYPRFRRARAHKVGRRTTGNVSITSSTWTNLDNGLDIALEAQVGDLIEVGINGLWGAEAVTGYLDVVTVVATVPVNQVSSGAAETGTSEGAVGWTGVSGSVSPVSGSLMYSIVNGDLASLVVTLRIRVRGSSASAKTVYANTNEPFQFWAKNLGPADPN